MDNYATIERKLRNRETFRGNSMWARYSGPFNTGVYEVFSYNTLIATTHANGTFEVATRKYSTTTSRHQNLIKRVWGGNAGVLN